MFDAVMRPVRAAQRLSRKCSTAAGALLSRNSTLSFAKNERGNVAMIFGLTSFVVVGIVGGAIDFGRAYTLKAKLQQSLDAASLAAASTYVNDPNHDVAAATTHGSKFFTASMSNVPGGAQMTLTLNQESQTVQMQASTTVKTPFLSIMGINTITMTAYSEATTTESLTGGGSLAQVEIAMMLDNTGSMDELTGSVTKMSALKTAAKKFVDILLPTTSTPLAKIALAPFAQNVNVGDTYVTLVTGEPLSKTVTDANACGTQQTCTNVCVEYRSNGQCKKTEQQCTTTAKTCTGYLSRCVVERTGGAAFTDAAPGTGTYFSSPTDTGGNGVANRYRWWSSVTAARNCGTSSTAGSRSPIMPLSQDRVALKAHIDGMDTWGSTAGQIGTAWAWYLLSPQWNSIFTGSHAPLAYGTPKNKKIAVLMTDGEYNTWYVNQGDSIQQAKDMCHEMKHKDIEIFTVGFKLGGNATAIATLKDCATDDSHAFQAEDAAALEAVFREIAYRAVPLHLNQ